MRPLNLLLTDVPLTTLMIFYMTYYLDALTETQLINSHYAPISSSSVLTIVLATTEGGPGMVRNGLVGWAGFTTKTYQIV